MGASTVRVRGPPDNPMGLGRLVTEGFIPPRILGSPDAAVISDDPGAVPRVPDNVQEAWEGPWVVDGAYLYRETDVGFANLIHKLESGNPFIIGNNEKSGDGHHTHDFEKIHAGFIDGSVLTAENNDDPGDRFTYLGGNDNSVWVNADEIRD